jgi:hypothetical protein
MTEARRMNDGAIQRALELGSVELWAAISMFVVATVILASAVVA